MKHTIEIECPDGYKPVYNNRTGKVEIVKEHHFTNIKSFKDACEYLGIKFKSTGDKHADAIIKIDIIGRALNNNYQFAFADGTIYYPYLLIDKKVPDKEHIKVLVDQLYFLVGGHAHPGGDAGLGRLYAYTSPSDLYANVGLFPCKSKEIAEHFSKYFIKEIFDAIYAGQIDYEYV